MKEFRAKVSTYNGKDFCASKFSVKINYAFTLAEVLITLAVIGIVATLTIPTLYSKYQKMQYVTALKKDYSVWNQALAKMATDSGCPGDLSCFFDSSDIGVLGDKIIKYFNVVKVCRSTVADTSACDALSGMDAMVCRMNANTAAQASAKYGCWADHYNIYFDGSTGTENYRSYRFITSDGMAVDMNMGTTEKCPQFRIADKGYHQSSSCMGPIMIDVNGLNKPNVMGRDIFYFWITNGKGPELYPEATNEISEIYWKNQSTCGNGTETGPVTTGSGLGCAARIIEDGWQMNY